MWSLLRMSHSVRWSLKCQALVGESCHGALNNRAWESPAVRAYPVMWLKHLRQPLQCKRKLRTSQSQTYTPTRCNSIGGSGEDAYHEGHPMNASDRTLHEFLTWNLNVLKRSSSTKAKKLREGDEGDWKYSPEWWGTHGGGWGRDNGETVFELPSSMGNGIVSVTAHAATTPGMETLLEIEKQVHQNVLRNNSKFRGAGLFQVVGHEWRVLRFNNTTRQSVAKVVLVCRDADDSEMFVLQQPNCIAFEYVKSMISAGLAAVSLSGFNLKQVANASKTMRVLCVGLGGGSLPLFLAHHLRGATVDVVEIDGVVIAAATQAMGFPCCKFDSNSGALASLKRQANLEQILQETSVVNVSSGIPHTEPSYDASTRSISDNQWKKGPNCSSSDSSLRSLITGSLEDKAALWGETLNRILVHESDGETFVSDSSWKEAAKHTISWQYDMVFVDAYDGEDVMPSKFQDHNGAFLNSLSSLLHPSHGTVVVNLHTDSDPPSLLERISGKFGPGFDPSLPQGNQVQQAAVAYRSLLLSGGNTENGGLLRDFKLRSGSGNTAGRGAAFTVAVALQGNVILVASRGVSLSKQSDPTSQDTVSLQEQALVDALTKEAFRVEEELGLNFDVSRRVARGLHVVKA